MKILVIGSGGREHTIAWRLKTDGSASEVFVAPGNGGIDPRYCVDMNISDHKAVITFCKQNAIDMVVVGPEGPLCDGLADSLQQAGVRTFGPSAKAARLEGSKLFAKSVMEKSKVPTARHLDFTGKEALVNFFNTNETYPIVIKLDGLAAGKGVGIPASREEALAFLDETVGLDTPVYIEDFIDGEEASILGVSDGERVYPLIVAQDHKRIFDGDKGPNTGGMGAYAPAPVATAEIIERTRLEVLQPVIDTMRRNSTPFKGILYAGMMISKKDINVIEFNVRFGDPEAQVILPLIDGRLVDILQASIDGKLTPDLIKFKKKHAITVVMTAGGYPGNYEKGKEIHGLDKVSDKVIVFHAGTIRKEGKYYTNGGRVLAVTALADDLETARNIVYGEISKISFEGSFYRKDIAHRALI